MRKPDVEEIEEVRANRAPILRLSHKALESVPQEIWAMDWLEELDLSYNQLDSVLAPSGCLPRLKTLDLRHNPLRDRLTPRPGLILDWDVAVRLAISERDIFGLRLSPAQTLSVGDLSNLRLLQFASDRDPGTSPGIPGARCPSPRPSMVCATSPWCGAPRRLRTERRTSSWSCPTARRAPPTTPACTLA
jgi:hypothetical protein